MQKTCIIIPCYNEEKRLPIEKFEQYFQQSTDVDFCFVNDGSNDNTIKVLTSLKIAYPSKVHVLDLIKNGGKAEAIRQGMLHVISLQRYKYLGFLDADLATPLTEIQRLIEYIESNIKICVSFGSRVKLLGSQIERTARRHYLGRIFSTFASIMLKMPIYDTQCGAKLFKIEIVQIAFSQPFITRWLFDIEIFARIRNHLGLEIAMKSMIEMPLNKWIEMGGSKLSLKHMITVPLQLIKIKQRYRYE